MEYGLQIIKPLKQVIEKLFASGFVIGWDGVSGLAQMKPLESGLS